MWYEILPTVGLIAGFLSLPAIVHKGIVYVGYNGKSSGRYWEADNRDFHLYLRDRRITGSEYVPKGLEGVPKES